MAMVFSPYQRKRSKSGHSVLDHHGYIRECLDKYRGDNSRKDKYTLLGKIFLLLDQYHEMSSKESEKSLKESEHCLKKIENLIEQNQRLIDSPRTIYGMARSKLASYSFTKPEDLYETGTRRAVGSVQSFIARERTQQQAEPEQDASEQNRPKV